LACQLRIAYAGVVKLTVLKVTRETDETDTIFVLEGRLTGTWVQVLEDSWRESVSADRTVRVMVCGVTFIDDKGKALLSRMHRQGAELVAEGCMNKAIVEEITGGERK
jgi:hypothetical protein